MHLLSFVYLGKNLWLLFGQKKGNFLGFLNKTAEFVGKLDQKKKDLKELRDLFHFSGVLLRSRRLWFSGRV